MDISIYFHNLCKKFYISNYDTLTILAFLIILVILIVNTNKFLNGVLKSKIHNSCGIILIILLISIFYFTNIYFAILSLILSIIILFTTQPLGARIAAFVLRGFSKGNYPGYPSKKLRKITDMVINDRRNLLNLNFNRNKYAVKLKDGTVKMMNSDDVLLYYSASLPSINYLLKEYNINIDNLREIYYQLMRCGGVWGGPHYIPTSSLCYPLALQYIIKNGVNEMTAFKLLMYFERGQLPQEINIIHAN